jgi:peptidoglycan/LPS O-acetylase OafA/YrhL
LTQRLQSLDALRGVAILMVLIFHFFYFSAAPFNSHNIYPFKDAFTGVTLFKYGYLGVNLFFIISGFVIAMTLESCTTPVEFLIKRFARIWPALLVWALITFEVLYNSSSPFGLERRVAAADFLPSLTLTPFQLWSGIFPNADYVDGTYWSLVVEVRFYMIAVIIFWLFDKSQFARNMAICAVLAIVSRALLKRVAPQLEQAFDLALIPSSLPWFAAGALFYSIYKRAMTHISAACWLGLMFCLSVKYSSFPPEYERSLVTIAAFTIAFYLAFWLISTRLGILASAKPFVLIGTWSYSIYLLHYGIGMTLISLIPESLSLPTQTTYVVALIAVCLQQDTSLTI